MQTRDRDPRPKVRVDCPDCGRTTTCWCGLCHRCEFGPLLRAMLVRSDEKVPQ